MIEQTNALLNHEWTPNERSIIKRIIDSLLYYKYMIPTNLKSDIISILDLANKIKHEYTILNIQKLKFFDSKVQNSNNLYTLKRRNSI